MNTIITINKREAVPVRAIPFITGWTMSPDVVAKILAHSDGWRTALMDMHAYHLTDHDQYAQMLPKEWDGVIAELESLSNIYQMDEDYEGGNYVLWRKESIPLLPPGTFVWRDELEQAFKLDYSPNKHILVEERPGDRELNFSPFVPENLSDAVMQGFEPEKIEIVTEKSLLTRERETVLKLIIAMAIYGYKYDSAAQRSNAVGEISHDLEELGIALDQDTIRKWLREAAMQLPAKPIGT